jgi:hypothetical protein
MKVEPADISSVNGYDVVRTDGTYAAHQVDERDGLRQVGPRFDTFEAAAEYVLSLPNPLQNPDI